MNTRVCPMWGLHSKQTLVMVCSIDLAFTWDTHDTCVMVEERVRGFVDLHVWSCISHHTWDGLTPAGRAFFIFLAPIFTSQIKLAHELLYMNVCIFTYFALSFQQSYHEDDVCLCLFQNLWNRV
jgi:hypothetical protein